MHDIKICIINSCKFVENFLFQPVKNCRVYQIAQTTLKNAVDFISLIPSKVRHYCSGPSSSFKKITTIFNLFQKAIMQTNTSAISSSGLIESHKRSQLELKYKEIREKNLSDAELGKALVIAYADVYHPIPESKFERSYPTIQIYDILNFIIREEDLLNKIELAAVRKYLYTLGTCPYQARVMSKHRQSLSYQDENVVAIHKLEKIEHACFYYQGTTEMGRKVVLQNGIRGSLAACTTMLISDRLEKHINPIFMNVVSDSDIQNISWNNKLVARFDIVKNLDELKIKLKEVGPACVSVYTCGYFEIVVDSVEEDGVNIRDPYHGWAIKITLEAFLQSSSLKNGSLKILQVTDPTKHS